MQVRDRASIPTILGPTAFIGLNLPTVALFAICVALPTLIVILAGTSRLFVNLSNPDLIHRLWLAVKYTLWTTFPQFVLGFIAALAVWQIRSRLLQALVIALLFLPYAIPTAVAVLAWELLLRTQGVLAALLNALFGIRQDAWFRNDFAFSTLVIASIWQFFPFVFVTILSYLLRFPPKLLLTAATDGADRGNTLLHVVVPIMGPALAAVFFLRWVFMFCKLDLALLMGGNDSTTAIDVFPLWAVRESQTPGGFGDTAAVGLIALLVGGAISGTVLGIGRVLSHWLSKSAIGRDNKDVMQCTKTCSRSRSFVAGILHAGCIIAIIIFAIGPLAAVGAGSFLPDAALDRGLNWQTLGRANWGELESHWAELSEGTPLGAQLGVGLRNTVLVSLATTLIVGLAALMSGYAFTRYPSRLRRSVPTLSLGVYLVPLITISLGLNAMFGWMNCQFAVAVPKLARVVFAEVSLCLPLAVMLMIEYLAEVPTEYDRTAAADGARPLRRLAVVARRGLPGLMIVLSICFLLTWNDSLAPLLFDAPTLPIVLSQKVYQTEQAIRYGLFATASLMVSLPAIAAFVTIQLYVARRLRHDRA